MCVCACVLQITMSRRLCPETPIIYFLQETVFSDSDVNGPFSKSHLHPNM